MEDKDEKPKPIIRRLVCPKNKHCDTCDEFEGCEYRKDLSGDLT